MAVTLWDIARELDVSATTVSRSLRHDKAIHPDTRARVNEAARRLGYKGRLGRPRRPVEQDNTSGTLGLLLRHSSLDAAQYDGNLMRMMSGIISVMDERKMHLKTYTQQSQEQQLGDDFSSLLTSVEEGECQALIAHGAQDKDQIRFLAQRMPVVSMGRIYEDLSLDAALADNVQGVRGLVTHLAELGHRRLAWVGAHYTTSFIEARQAGFIQGCLRHGLELGRHSCFGPEIFQERTIHDKAALLSAVNSGVTGLVCSSDSIALDVIQVLEETGRRVPDDVSVTGFDAWLAQAQRRCVTSLDPNFFEIGKSAARLALLRLAHPMDEPHFMSVRGKILIGDTTAPPPGTP